MATDVGERIAKLLRLASPKSGSTEAERTSAALEAAKLFGEFELQIIPVPPKRPKRFRTEQPAPYRPPAPPPTAYSTFAVPWRPPSPPSYGGGRDWTAAVVDGDAICVACGTPLHDGEEAWFSGSYNRYRCYDITCANG